MTRPPAALTVNGLLAPASEIAASPLISSTPAARSATLVRVFRSSTAVPGNTTRRCSPLAVR